METCACGQPRRPRQKNCLQCNREANRKYWRRVRHGAPPKPRKGRKRVLEARERKRLKAQRAARWTLAFFDSIDAAGLCMWRAATDSPCGKPATVRHGAWLACCESHVPKKLGE